MYVRYAGTLTDAPLAYHLAVALGLMATAAPVELRVQHGNEVYATAWCLLVGASGKTRKTTCIRIGENLLLEACPDRVGDRPGSTEVLEESIIAHPQQVILFPEFGDFLAKTTTGYLSPLREKLTELWDARVATRKLVKKEISVEDPRLSILAGVTPGFLEEHTRTTDWMDGFMSRFATFIAAQDPRRRAAIPDRRHAYLRPHLVDRLRRLAQAEVGRCCGFDRAATATWVEWNDAIGKRYEDGVLRYAAGAVERAPIVALKAALLYSLDFGGADSGRVEWLIGEEATRCGIAAAELHLASVLHIVQGLAGSPYGRMRQAVLEAIGDAPRTKGEIFRRCNPKIAPRDADQVLAGLREEGTIHVHVVSTGATYYSRVPIAEPEPGKVEAAPLPDNVVTFPLPGSAVAPAPTAEDAAALDALRPGYVASPASTASTRAESTSHMNAACATASSASERDANGNPDSRSSRSMSASVAGGSAGSSSDEEGWRSRW